MKRAALLFLVACGGAREPVAKPEPLPSPPASASSAPDAAADPVAVVRRVIPHWLELLAHDEDQQFLEEAIAPEQLETVLHGETMSALVDGFRGEKHERVVELLHLAQTSPPERVETAGTTRVLFRDPKVVARKNQIAFDVVGGRVYIEN